MIEKDATFGERIADTVAGFGGSWTFIIAFGVALAIYMTIDAALGQEGVGSVSVYFAEFVSVDAGGGAGSGDHDEPEPAGHEGPAARRTGF